MAQKDFFKKRSNKMIVKSSLAFKLVKSKV